MVLQRCPWEEVECHYRRRYYPIGGGGNIDTVVLPTYREKPSPDDVFTSLFSGKQAAPEEAYADIKVFVGRLGDTAGNRPPPLPKRAGSVHFLLLGRRGLRANPLLNILTVFIALHNAEAVVDFGRPAPPPFQLIPIDSRGYHLPGRYRDLHENSPSPRDSIYCV